MRHRRLTLAALAVLALAGAARSDVQEDAVRARLLRDVSAEAAAVRERAEERLEAMRGLTADEVSAALRTATPRALPLLFRLAAVRGMADLAPEIAKSAAGADAPAAEAAIRTLVSFGWDGVRAADAALDAATALPAAERDARRRHVRALDLQRRVEQDVVSRWRRKGGSYRGRYKALEAYGWEAQPILLAMLLDVPLEDQFVVTEGGPDAADAADVARRRHLAIAQIQLSRRRGYRTFEPLPQTIEPNDLFDLAKQALADVGDLSVLGGVLHETRIELLQADGGAWRPRRFEDGMAQQIEEILAARGDRRPLEMRRRALEGDVVDIRRRLSRFPNGASDQLGVYAMYLEDLAGVLHQLGEFDDAAARFAQAIAVRSRSGKEPSVVGYNRACSLARGGRKDEAIEQLGRALDREISSGSEDLTRQWVMEDGDLETLHDDPRFKAILLERFGPGD